MATASSYPIGYDSALEGPGLLEALV